MTASPMNPLKALATFGQSVWLDYIRHDLIASGELARMIHDEGLRGMTSNPAIFKSAIAGSSEYQDQLAQLVKQFDEPMRIYEQIAIGDIRDAADTLRSVYDNTRRRDGYVSLEVSPYLARDTESTIQEARRLWSAVDRPNLMIKVPATPEGIPAIRQLISEGINVNVTLIFAVSAYREVAEAFVAGLERRRASGAPIDHVASVASFFVSRIDTSVDQLLDAKIQQASEPARATWQNLRGKAAIANAKVAYHAYGEIFGGERWKGLASVGAQTQRVLWASTGTKNPNYRDVMYVEELIGKETVNTIPPATWQAFLDHGVAKSTLVSGLPEARQMLASLESAGISLDSVTDQLLDAGVKLFADAFDDLLSAIDKACALAAQVGNPGA